MSDKNPTDVAAHEAPKAKRSWVRPAIEIAEARQAEAFGGPPGGVDYGIYS